MDNDKQQRWPDTFSGLQYLQYIKNESKEGKKEFSRIAEDEKKRVQQVAEKENQRIMQEMRENGTIKMCPICLEQIHPIRSCEERNRESMVMLCCGITHCSNCTEKSIQDMYGTSRNDPKPKRCYNCREPHHDAIYLEKTIKPDDKRHWMLEAVATCYFNGTIRGIKKNNMKAFELYQRAADLGNAEAQEMLASMYLCGKLGPPECFDKARYYAEKAANQGSREGQYILANLLLFHGENNENKAFELLTLAAYQGCQKSQCVVAAIYEESDKVTMTTKTAEDDVWRKNILLSLYWYGKGSEVATKDSKPGHLSLVGMAYHLNLAMSVLWHPRDHSNIHSIPGYSHVPFCTWALAKGGLQHRPSDITFSEHRLLDTNAWKNVCANCGTKSREQEQLKACARCRAFRYCSKQCQVQHWKAGHKVDCKGHWIEEFFPNIRNVHK